MEALQGLTSEQLEALQGLTSEQLEVLQQLAKQQAHASYDLYSPFQYPWMTFNMLIAELVISYLIRRFLGRWQTTCQQFRALAEDKKRNVVTYVILFFGTTLALLAQLYGGIDILYRGEDVTSQSRMDWCIFSVQCIMLLYIWELIYRVSIGIPLLIHHICTLLLCQLVSSSFYDQRNVIYLRFALLFAFHATLEQISFFALFLFRLDLWHQKQSLFFFIATAQAFLLKTVVTVISVIYFSIEVHRNGDSGGGWPVFWKYAFIPLLLLLYLAQLYACHVMYVLGRRTRVDVRKEEGRIKLTTKRELTLESCSTCSDMEMGDAETTATSIKFSI